MAMTYEFVAGGLISAEQINTNFAELDNRTFGITADQLADRAGINSEQLTDKFSIMCIPIQVVPRLASTGLVVNYTPPNTTGSPGTKVIKIPLVLPPGKQAYFVGVAVDVQAVTPDAGKYPTWWLSYNGNVIGGGNPTNVSAAGVYYGTNPGPYASPIAAVTDGGYFEIGLGVTAAGAQTWSGVTFYLYFKIELGA